MNSINETTVKDHNVILYASTMVNERKWKKHVSVSNIAMNEAVIHNINGAEVLKSLHVGHIRTFDKNKSNSFRVNQSYF